MRKVPDEFAEQPLMLPKGEPQPRSPFAAEGIQQLPATAEEGQRAELSASHYLWLLRTHWLKMLIFMFLAVLATAMITLRLTKIYESTAILYVDRGAAKNIVGQDSQASAPGNADADAFLASQLRILQSDAVVRPVAEKFHLLEREKQIDPVKSSSPATHSTVIGTTPYRPVLN